MDEKESGSQVTLQNVSVLSGQNMVSIIDKMASHMKFFAIFYIVYGAIMCLTIFGAIIGIPMIIYNLKLKESADQFREFSGSKDFFVLNKALENQEKFFFFHKVLLIISIIFMILYITFLIVFGASLFMDMSQNFA